MTWQTASVRSVGFAALVVAGCVPSDPDLPGTYAASGTGSCRLADGRTVTIAAPDEFVLKAVSRSYQYYRYQVTVGSCTLSGDGDAKGASFRGHCSVDVPSIGAVDFEPSGGFWRQPGTLRLVLHGPTRDPQVESCVYDLDGKRK